MWRLLAAVLLISGCESPTGPSTTVSRSRDNFIVHLEPEDWWCAVPVQEAIVPARAVAICRYRYHSTH